VQDLISFCLIHAKGRLLLMRRLLGSFERSLSLLNAITDGVIAQDENDQLIYVNDAMAQMSGFESAEVLINASVTELIERLQILDEQGQVLTPTQLPGHIALKGHEVPERELRYSNPYTGEVAWLALKAQPVFSADGRLQFAVSIIRDITQRKQLESRTLELLAERERVKVLQRFVSDMSHDFRTPLSILSSSLYLMQKNIDPEKQHTHALKAADQIHRMERLLSELLQSARLDENKARFQFSLANLNTFLEPLIQEYIPMAAEKGIEINYLPDADSCTGRIDSIEFDHVFRNLVENAIAYTPNGGCISIHTQSQDDRACISIEDTGIGISASDLPHIFERFYRADQARSTATGGNGLGLSIVKRIVEEHKGSIDVTSTIDVGTRFIISLPSKLDDL
jgi:PAS domain S-box-containing protein